MHHFYSNEVNAFGEATIDMETSFVEDMMVMETTLLKDIMELNETSNEDSCDNMNEKSIEKEEFNELVERLCIFDSISFLSKESKHFVCSKEKKRKREKSERVKENECFIEKQESEKEDQREFRILLEGLEEFTRFPRYIKVIQSSTESN
ncbi:hypothetical protein M9H77_18627 [Catharanthus roseus]|uniref:Uncharacterized protein n=1 Tax=Catharanthus roseus TaxID=4058 RepID=A0ACC0B7Z1_CATRO|nr:hypothetical protein M9H77_18627 [Catharanthus roseus]